MRKVMDFVISAGFAIIILAAVMFCVYGDLRHVQWIACGAVSGVGYKILSERRNR